MQQNVGGALPGIGTMANYGGMRYTNAVFAEDEAACRKAGSRTATERHGYSAGAIRCHWCLQTALPTSGGAARKRKLPEEDTLKGM